MSYVSTEHEDNGVFEITDFTTATDWERFIARIEEVIHSLHLTGARHHAPLGKGEVSNCSWEEKTDIINFSNFSFKLSHHCVKNKGLESEIDTDNTDLQDVLPEALTDMMNIDNDFPPRAHCLTRWYGVCDFCVISPVSDKDDICTTEPRIQLLLSSVNVALSNTNCQVPLFVQICDRWRRVYVGACMTPHARADYKIVHLKYLPDKYTHLTGLLNMFKLKLGASQSPLPTVNVSVRFTYVLQDWTSYSWPQLPPDLNEEGCDNVGATGDFSTLPFGAIEDPISELHLSTTWPCLSEEMIVDNDVYSDLDPVHAPQWSVRVKMTNSPQCLLHEHLNEMVKLCQRQESMEQILGRKPSDSSDPNSDISQALHRLTDPGPVHIPTLSSVVARAKGRVVTYRPQQTPISEHTLDVIMELLFPDSCENIETDQSQDATSTGTDQSQDATSTGTDQSQDTTSTETDQSQDATSTETNQSQEPTLRGTDQSQDDDAELPEKDLERLLKSSPVRSITHSIAVCICIVNHSHGGLKAVAQLWQEIVLELRYRLENNIELPGLSEGLPNLGTSLIHQKLQMLNYCIQKRIHRETRAKATNTSSTNTTTSIRGRNKPVNTGDGTTADSRCLTASIDSDDEFYECEDYNEDTDPTMVTKVTTDAGEEMSWEDEMAIDEIDLPSELKLDSYQDSFSHLPEGRLRPCGDLHLLNVDEPLYIPITQEPAPMTEDKLEEHAEVLTKLGSTSEGSELRARLQSACLRSDMQSFKSANPGCVLGDFVRWYSPRDWVIDTDTHDGHLSHRMVIPGNIWTDVWNSAWPVPAHRQRRLFDDTKESEIVLHQLISIKPAQLIHGLLPHIIHAAIRQIQQSDDGSVKSLPSLMEHIISDASSLCQSKSLLTNKLERVLDQMKLAEIVITRTQSLTMKFSGLHTERVDAQHELERFVSSLIEQPEVDVLGAGRGPAGDVIRKLFAAAQRGECTDEDYSEFNLHSSDPSCPVTQFPSPVGREFILRTMVSNPAPYSRTMPQRMYCVLSKGEYRVAGAFSSDTTFQ